MPYLWFLHLTVHKSENFCTCEIQVFLAKSDTMTVKFTICDQHFSLFAGLFQFLAIRIAEPTCTVVLEAVWRSGQLVYLVIGQSAKLYPH